MNSFLECEHLVALEIAGTSPPLVDNPQADLIRRKGDEHEAAYLASLRVAGKTVVEPDDAEDAARLIREATADVIYQPEFEDPAGWRGRADFLELQTGGTYEVVDTKLARHAKPYYILQLCFYSEQVARIQGRAPRQMHVVLGSGERASFRPEEFGAYYRRVRKRLEQFVANPPPTEPWPVQHCAICDFRSLCEAYWEETDSLSRVYGMRRNNRGELADLGVSTLAELAHAQGLPEKFDRIHEHAELQLWARENNADKYVLQQPQPELGFALLPDPSPGDLFFDFEGNPFWDSEGSLEYLWGILDVDGNFTPLHAHDHDTERAAFEAFIDLVRDRLARHPDLHVYHYAAYEITALRRLMGRHGTREAELDDLLRRGVFVDLLKVVRNGLRASRRGYGLKEMEAFLDFERRAEIKEGGTSIIVFEQWMQSREPALIEQLDAYNREDCIATRLLRDWLLELRAEAVARFGPLPQPEPKEPRETPPRKAERAALRAQLLEAGEELAAHLLDYHDRERKPVWWAFFDRLEMSADELVEDAESIGKLELTGGPEPVLRSHAYTFTFPPQEHKLGPNQDVAEPTTGNNAGEITALDRDARSLVLKRGPSLDDVPLPDALIPKDVYRTNDQEDALERIGHSLLARDRRYPAVESILRREPFERDVQHDDLTQLVLSLDRRHLVIQGPPGSGKTWTIGRLIPALVAAGKTVGVASQSHKAIHNVLDAIDAPIVGKKKASGGNPESFYEGANVENVTDNDAVVDCDVAAGTAWLFSDPDHERTLDYLFIDEAGQVSLADALAMATCARNVILVGDPQQLAQVIQGSHPPGSSASVLTHLLGDADTIPPDRGVFLERTFRLHPDVCAYISEEFYDGRLQPDASTTERTTPFGTGLRYIEVAHEGNRQDSREEVDAVRAEVERLHAAGVRDLMVVAPYNAQVNALREALPANVRVGTVDKFQGQEADVVLYSMASSSGEDVPRGLEFLFSRNRFNVAISRAECLAYLVCSPRLLEVDCRTIDHMRLANALCRFVELAHA
ncbi:MAG: TM0106 family RecB-like putative nuclease [Gaiellaceae bacterium]